MDLFSKGSSVKLYEQSFSNTYRTSSGTLVSVSIDVPSDDSICFVSCSGNTTTYKGTYNVESGVVHLVYKIGATVVEKMLVTGAYWQPYPFIVLRPGKGLHNLSIYLEVNSSSSIDARASVLKAVVV